MKSQAVWPLCAGLALAGWWLHRVAQIFWIDDAYIFYRYAANAAAGVGLVYNPGERVEGVTAPLWTLLLTVCAWLGLPLEKTAPILTGGFGLIAAAQLYRMVSGLEAPARRLAPAAVVLWMLHPGWSLWSVSGMETMLFTVVLLAAGAAWMQEADQPRPWGSGLWTALLLLLRPEAVVVVACFVLDFLLRKPLDAGAAKRLARWLAVPLGAGACLTAARLLYYGEWLPMTYYAKTGGSFGARFARGVVYNLEFLSSWAPGSIAQGAAQRQLFGLLWFQGALWAGFVCKGTRSLALLMGSAFIVIAAEGGGIGCRLIASGCPSPRSGWP